jgi:chromosome transmission fidelity protein 18
MLPFARAHAKSHSLKKYTQRMHRAALLWLKEWDECVFGSASKTAGAELKRERRRKRAREGNALEKAVVGEGAAANDDDEWRRPKDKVPLLIPQIAQISLTTAGRQILLLHGGAGLGKTTLAHVLATQVGYRVHELNASDDRTAAVVEERIRNALDSQAILNISSSTGKNMAGKDGWDGKGRPTCLVIDEIDGADAVCFPQFSGADLLMLMNRLATEIRTTTGETDTRGQCRQEEEAKGF